MKYLFILLFTFSAFAEDKRVYPVDSVGNRDYSKPAFAIHGDKVYEVDSVGNRKYDGQSYKLEETKIYPTDTVGNKRY